MKAVMLMKLDISSSMRYQLLSSLHDARYAILLWDNEKDWDFGVPPEQHEKALQAIYAALDALDAWRN